MVDTFKPLKLTQQALDIEIRLLQILDTLNKIMKEVKNIDYGLEKIFEGAQDFLPLLVQIT